jgi:hypothetical protein
MSAWTPDELLLFDAALKDSGLRIVEIDPELTQWEGEPKVGRRSKPTTGRYAVCRRNRASKRRHDRTYCTDINEAKLQKGQVHVPWHEVVDVADSLALALVIAFEGKRGQVLSAYLPWEQSRYEHAYGLAMSRLAVDNTTSDETYCRLHDIFNCPYAHANP